VVEVLFIQITLLTPSRVIKDILGLNTYLGVPFFKSVHKSKFLRAIIDNIKNKLSSWKGKLLV